MTSDGIHLNLGCDPTVQTNGITAADAITVNGKTSWILTSGTRWWSYDVSAMGNQGAFVNGGKNFAVFLRTLSPDCTAKTQDGIAMNPGCDPNVQVNGISALASVSTSITSAKWLVIAGKKWWLYDSKAGTSGAFSGGVKDIASSFRLLSPDCTVMKGGVPLNPGCDPDVKAKGITSIDISISQGKTSWWLMTGKKWWSFDQSANNGKGAFVDGGQDVSTSLRMLNPTSCAAVGNGLHQNPGCEADVQVNGLDTAGHTETNSGGYWLVTSGKKWWIFDASTGVGSFATWGNDVATYFRTLNPH